MPKIRYILTNLAPILLVLVGWLSLDLIRDRIPKQSVIKSRDNQPFLYAQEGRQRYARADQTAYDMTFVEAAMDVDGRFIAHQPVLISYGVKEGQKIALFHLVAANLSWRDEEIILEKDVVLSDLSAESRITADRAFVQVKGGRVNFTDHVVLTQDQMTLRSDVLTAEARTEDNASRIFTAHGAPLVYTNVGATNIRSRAERMRYVIHLPGSGPPAKVDGGIDRRMESLEMHGSPLWISSLSQEGASVQIEGQHLLMPNREQIQVQGAPASFVYHHEGRKISGKAASIHYAVAKNQLELNGQVSLTDREMVINSDRLFYDTNVGEMWMQGLPASFRHHRRGQKLRGGANRIYHILAKGHLQLKGDAFLTNDEITVYGEDLLYDMHADNLRLSGSDAKTPGGQVEISIPKRQSQSK